MSKQFFVTGTDTNVGKTVVSAILTAGLQACYWKPVQTGIESDIEWVKSTTQFDNNRFFPATYHFSAPLSPHHAAALEGDVIDFDKFVKPSKESLIIEGAGGLMVPLDHRFFMIDLIKKMEVPVILVARSTLGTLNHTLMSLEMLRMRAIPVLGVVINGPKNILNRQSIESLGKVPILAELEVLANFNSESLSCYFSHYFNEQDFS